MHTSVSYIHPGCGVREKHTCQFPCQNLTMLNLSNNTERKEFNTTVIWIQQNPATPHKIRFRYTVTQIPPPIKCSSDG